MNSYSFQTWCATKEVNMGYFGCQPICHKWLTKLADKRAEKPVNLEIRGVTRKRWWCWLTKPSGNPWNDQSELKRFNWISSHFMKLNKSIRSLSHTLHVNILPLSFLWPYGNTIISFRETNDWTALILNSLQSVELNFLKIANLSYKQHQRSNPLWWRMKRTFPKTWRNSVLYYACNSCNGSRVWTGALGAS